MLIEEGYEYKAGETAGSAGKGQKRFIPSGHWERDIPQKISGRSLPVRKRWSESQRETGKECRFKRTGSRSSWIDIQAKIQEGKGGGYTRWASVFNLKQMAQAMMFLKEHEIESYGGSGTEDSGIHRAAGQSAGIRKS